MLFQTIERANKGGLARSGWAEDDNHFTFFYFHIDPLQSMEFIKPFMDVLANNDRFGCDCHNDCSYKRVLTPIAVSKRLLARDIK